MGRRKRRSRRQTSSRPYSCRPCLIERDTACPATPHGAPIHHLPCQRHLGLAIGAKPARRAAEISSPGFLARRGALAAGCPGFPCLLGRGDWNDASPRRLTSSLPPPAADPARILGLPPTESSRRDLPSRKGAEPVALTHPNTLRRHAPIAHDGEAWGRTGWQRALSTTGDGLV